jgi:Ca2+-binding EF-hand superfamily protein
MFDINSDGNIDYDELMRSVAGEMSPYRKALVKKAFDKLDANKNGIIEIDDIKAVYNGK